MYLPTKERVIKKKYDGELKKGDIVYTVQREEREPEKWIVHRVRSDDTAILRKYDSPFLRRVEKRDSGYWGGLRERGFLMHSKDISLRDRIENFK